MSHFIEVLWEAEQIQCLFWLSFSIRYFHVSLATEKRASSIKPDLPRTVERNAKEKWKICGAECEAVSPSLPAPRMLSMCHMLHITYKATDLPFLSTHWLAVLSPQNIADIRFKMGSIFQQIHCLVNRSYKAEAQKAPQGFWAPAKFLPLEPAFRAWNMCHFPQPRLMQHKGLPFFKMLALTQLSWRITTFLPAELPSISYIYQLVFL